MSFRDFPAINNFSPFSILLFCFFSYAFRLAALEIAKFQDQLIKRLNEDAVLQLPHDTDINGQTPATEAVLLFHQHGLTPHHTHHHHHEWNFARAFLYSLTVLTTIGECIQQQRSKH